MKNRKAILIFLILISAGLLSLPLFKNKFSFGSQNEKVEGKLKEADLQSDSLSSASTSNLASQSMSNEKSVGSMDKTNTIQNKMQDDDSADSLEACYQRITGQVEPFDFRQIKKQRLQTMISPWLIQAPKGSWPDPAVGHPINAFYEALASANLLQGKFELPTKKDPVALLKQLHHKDPLNSAPLVFLGIIYERQNNSDELKSVLQSLNNTKYFNSYVTEFSRYLFGLADNTEEYVVVMGIYSNLVVPDYTALRNFAEKYKLSEVGFQMIKANYAENVPIIEGVNAFSVEYVIGEMLLRKKLGIEINFPTPKQYFQKLTSESNEVQIAEDIKTSCDIRAFTPIFEKNKKNLKLFSGK